MNMLRDDKDSSSAFDISNLMVMMMVFMVLIVILTLVLLLVTM